MGAALLRITPTPSPPTGVPMGAALLPVTATPSGAPEGGFNGGGAVTDYAHPFAPYGGSNGGGAVTDYAHPFGGRGRSVTFLFEASRASPPGPAGPEHINFLGAFLLRKNRAFRSNPVDFAD
jgi:hypothetical protein